MTWVFCPIVFAVAEVAIDRAEVVVPERERPVKVIEHHWCAGCGTTLP